MVVLGIDGAPKAGAEILLDDSGRARAVACWQTVRRSGADQLVALVADAQGVRGRAWPASTWQLARWCRSVLAPYTVGHELLVGVEDVFIGRNPRTSVRLAKVDAALAAPWAVDCEPTWITQGAWRKTSFPRRWTKTYPGRSRSEQAKAASLDVMPRLVPGLDALLGHVGRVDHVTDAAGVARHLLRG